MVLVTTGPIWVALLSWLIWRERLTHPVVLGLIVAVAAACWWACRTAADWGWAARSCGAIFWRWPGRGLWQAIDHRAAVRHRMSLLTYIYIVYGMAALWLIGLAVLSGASFTRAAQR